MPPARHVRCGVGCSGVARSLLRAASRSGARWCPRSLYHVASRSAESHDSNLGGGQQKRVRSKGLLPTRWGSKRAPARSTPPSSWCTYLLRQVPADSPCSIVWLAAGRDGIQIAPAKSPSASAARGHPSAPCAPASRLLHRVDADCCLPPFYNRKCFRQSPNHCKLHFWGNQTRNVAGWLIGSEGSGGRLLAQRVRRPTRGHRPRRRPRRRARQLHELASPRNHSRRPVGAAAELSPAARWPAASSRARVPRSDAGEVRELQDEPCEVGRP